MLVEEYTFQCPYCWQKVSTSVDLSVKEQSYVEDCEVCCNPVQLSYLVDDEGEVDVQVEALEQ